MQACSLVDVCMPCILPGSTVCDWHIYICYIHCTCTSYRIIYSDVMHNILHMRWGRWRGVTYICKIWALTYPPTCFKYSFCLLVSERVGCAVVSHAWSCMECWYVHCGKDPNGDGCTRILTGSVWCQSVIGHVVYRPGWWPASNTCSACNSSVEVTSPSQMAKYILCWIIDVIAIRIHLMGWWGVRNQLCQILTGEFNSTPLQNNGAANVYICCHYLLYSLVYKQGGR